MGAIQHIFNRREMKYLIDAGQFKALTEFLQEYAREDEYGRYMVGNTYFDTPAWAALIKAE